MKKVLAILALTLFLGGCENTKLGRFVATVESAATGTISPEAIYIARNAFNTVEVSATNYLSLAKCPKNTPVCRDPAITSKLVQAIRSGRIARNAATQFLRDHPNQLGPSGLYSALTTSTDTIRQILQQYNIG